MSRPTTTPTLDSPHVARDATFPHIWPRRLSAGVAFLPALDSQRSVTTPHVNTSTVDGVHTIELSRREKKNAITTAMYRAMSDAFEAAAADPSVRAVLLRGQADLFTAGNDLGDFLDGTTREEAQAHRFLIAISSFPKPVVAAVGGLAIGIGTTMLLHCDLVVAAAGTRFQLPFVPLGLCAEAGSSLLLPQMAGHRLAAELMLLGDPFDDQVARRAGIVNQVVAPESLLEVATTLAARLARQPADAMTTTKMLLKRSLGRSVHEAIADELPHFERLLQSDEARAIFRAFLEKR
jgi:enoyl-CoA hydratase/carnithine racemase